MSKLVNNYNVNFERENAFVMGEKKVRDENLVALDSIEKFKEKSGNAEGSEGKDSKQNELLNQSNAQIEKLEKLKIKIENENEELRKAAREFSDKILEDANKKAKEIVEDANIKSNEIIKKAKKDGYDTGYKKSLDELKNLLLEAKQNIDEAHEYKDKLLNDMESEIVNLILFTVNKIIRTKLTTDDDVIVNMILESIENLNSRENLVIKISSEDFEDAAMLRTKILAIYPGIKNIEIKIIDSFKSGDMEIESESGTVNPSIEAQIKRLYDEFLRMSSQETD